MSALVLGGDVGGTRARFALFDGSAPARPRLVHEAVLESRSFATFEQALERFVAGAVEALGKRPRIRAASFGIAGPVVDQRVKTTNLPWTIDARNVSSAFRIPAVTLLNDLVAVGLGALSSPPSRIAPIHGGRPRPKGGNVAVIAAGTGLGEAVFVWDGTRHVPCATEGSHVDFAPRTPVEARLCAKLAAEHGHVSYERVASGSTLSLVYDFIVGDERVRESRENRAAIGAAKDRNVAVVELALRGKSEAAMRAVELWSSVYGAESGNLALKCLASGGVYVCGGVSARLAKVLARGLPGRAQGSGPSPFVAAFLDKGRMRSLLERVPVAVCTEPMAGLRGAAARAKA